MENVGILPLYIGINRHKSITGVLKTLENHLFFIPIAKINIPSIAKTIPTIYLNVGLTSGSKITLKFPAMVIKNKDIIRNIIPTIIDVIPAFTIQICNFSLQVFILIFHI